MANGYSTGISSKAIDFASASSSYMKSAVESKLNEIKQKKAEVDQNVEKTLKAMSIKVIPELSGKLRDDYAKKVDEYRTELTNRMKNTGGRLGMEDLKFMEQGFVDITNEQLEKKTNLDKMKTAMDSFYKNPNAYDRTKFTSAMKDWQDKFYNNEDVPPPESILLASFKTAKPADYIPSTYKALMDRIDQGEEPNVNGRVFTKTTFDDPDSTRAFLDHIYRTDENMMARVSKYDELSGTFVVDEDMLKAELDTVTPLFQNVQTTTDTPSALRPSSSGGSGSTKPPLTFQSKEYKAGGKTFRIIHIPNVPQDMKTILLNKDTVHNLDTGQQEELSGDMEVAGIDVHNDVIFLRGKGGWSQVNGRTAYSTNSAGMGAMADRVAPSELARRAAFEEDINDPVKQKAALKQNTPNYKIDPPTTIENIQVEETEDGIVLTGEAVYIERNIGQKTRTEEEYEKRKAKGEQQTEKRRVPVRIEYKKVRDPKADATFTIPLYQNKERVANWFNRGYVMDGKSLEQWFADNEGGSTGATSASPSANDPAGLGL